MKPSACCHESNCCWSFIKFVMMVILIGSCYALAYFGAMARFEVRANTWNQIVYGMLLGGWCACTATWFVFEPLRRHVRAINKNEQMRSLWYYFGVATGFLFLAIATQLIIYLVLLPNETDLTNKGLWNHNIKNYCRDYNNQTYYLKASVKDMAPTFFGYGLYLGLLLNTYYYKGRQDIYSGPGDNSCFHCCKYLGRLILTLLLVAPYALVLLFLAFFQPTAWVHFTVSSIVITLMAATPTLWLDQCSAKCGLYSSKRAVDDFLDDSAEEELSEVDRSEQRDVSESDRDNKLSSQGDFNQYASDSVDK